MKTLFENVSILVKKDNKYTVIENGYLGINDKYITYIGQAKPSEEYDIKRNFSNKLLMPGLINCHAHSPMVFLRGFGAGQTLENWLNNYIFPTEAKMNGQIIKIASYYAILEHLASGVTSFSDMYFYPEETAKAVLESGIKANLCDYITSFGEDIKLEDSNVYRSLNFFRQYNNTGDGRLKIDFGIHAEYTNVEHIVKEYIKLCKENYGRIHVHISETKTEVENCKAKYGKTPVKWFADLGLFENPVCAAHVVWPEGDDLDILKNHDVTVVHNPSSNMTLGSGFAPINRIHSLGINTAIGTDGPASNNNLNMFEEMHLTSMLPNGFHLDPTYLTCDEVLDMATINGAKAQGRDDTGSLEIGKCADIIALDMTKINMYPTLDYPSLLVKSAQASDVYMTMVNGQILYEDGQYLTLNKKKIVEDFKTIVENFYKNNGKGA